MKLPANLQTRLASFVEGSHKESANVQDLPEAKCLNCGTEFRGHFCPNCGQNAVTKRFTLVQTLKHVLFIFTKFDDTFWHTVYELFTRPGYMIRDYIRGHRVEYLRPLQLLICLVTVYLIIVHLCFGESAIAHTNLFNDVDPVNKLRENEMLNMAIAMAENLMNNKLFSMLMSVTILASCTFCSFRMVKEGKAFNLAEHFYTMVYLECIDIIICFVMLPYRFVTHQSPMEGLNIWVDLLLMTIVYAQLMRVSWLKSTMMCFLAYCFLAVIMFIFFFIVFAVYYVIMGIPT